MSNNFKITIGIIFFILSCAGIATSSYFISTYPPIHIVSHSSSAWEFYGFVIFLVLSISFFIVSFILIIEYLYLKFINKKINKGDNNG